MYKLPRLKKGFSMVELLVVMFLIAFMIAFLTIVFVNNTKNAKVKAAHTLIHKLEVALGEYYAVFKEYPPDTGYGLPDDGGVNGATVQYDAGSLYRYLGQQLNWKKPKESGGFVDMGTYGPFIQHFTDKELKKFTHPLYGESYKILDPWQKEIGYIGSRARVIHNRDGVDIFSAGPDRKTASDDADGTGTGPGAKDHGLPGNLQHENYSYDGTPAHANAEGLGYSLMNGCLTAYKKQSTKKIGNADKNANEVLDDINNWDPGD